MDRPPLFDRDPQLQIIERGLDAADGGGVRVLVVEGYPGTGKSRLLAATRDDARARRMRVVERHGDPYAATDLGPENAEQELLAELTRASQGPTVVLLDDAQWVDQQTLRLVRGHLLAEHGRGVLVVLAIALGKAIDGGEGLLLELAADPRATVVSVGALDEGVAPQIASTANLPQSSAVALLRRAGGNPYLLTQLIRSIAEGSTDPAAVVPDSVVRWVRMRMGCVGNSALRLARSVAVLDEFATLDRATTLAELTESEAVEGADQLVQSGVLEFSQPLRFGAPILADAVLAEMPAFARSDAHHRSARMLHDDGARACSVAGHLLNSVARGEDWACQSLHTAGQDALAVGDTEVALHLLRRALAEPPTPELLHTVQLDLGRAEARAGLCESATSRLSAVAEQAPDASSRSEALRGLGELRSVAGAPGTASRTFDQAVAEAAGSAQTTRAAEIDRLGAQYFVTDRRDQLDVDIDRMITEAQDQGLPVEPGLLAMRAASFGVVRDPAPVVRAAVEKAMAAGPLHGGPPWQCGFSWATGALLHADDLPLAHRVLDDVAADLGDNPPSSLAGMLHMWRGTLAFHEGRLADARALAVAATDLARDTGLTMWLPWSAALEVLCAVEADEPSAAQRALDRCADIEAALMGQANILLARGRMQLEAGDAPTAFASFQAAGAALEQFGLEESPDALWRPWAALAASAVGADGEAAALIEAELPSARRSGAPRVLGVALMVAGLVKGGGIALLEESVSVLEQSPSRLELVRARVALGSALRAAGDSERAVVELRSALDAADACGSKILAATALRELRAMGRRPRRAARSGPAALTPTESRIARLAAGGARNADIAGELTLSARTVEWHLRNVFRKLEIGDRSGLAAALDPSAAQPR